LVRVPGIVPRNAVDGRDRQNVFPFLPHRAQGSRRHLRYSSWRRSGFPAPPLSEPRTPAQSNHPGEADGPRSCVFLCVPVCSSVFQCVPVCSSVLSFYVLRNRREEEEEEEEQAACSCEAGRLRGLRCCCCLPLSGEPLPFNNVTQRCASWAPRR